MNAANQPITTRFNGFSFIEVMLSLTLVASALVTLMALVPVGLETSRNATNSVIMGHILEDAHERLEGHALKDGALDFDPFFYDDEGIFVAPADPGKGSAGGGGSKIEIIEDGIEIHGGGGGDHKSARQLRRLYRVDIRLVSPDNEVIKKNAPDLKAVILTVTWPVNPLTGEPPDNIGSGNRKSITYYVNAMTGPGWSKIDPNFEAIIGF